MTPRPGSVNRASAFRSDDDFYETPESATRALLRAGVLPQRVWEPACGAGAISRVLIAAGHNVISTTLADRGYGAAGVDFLRCPWLLAPAIVTNPPFSLADEFVEHALSLRPDTAAFFLRLKHLEGRARFDATYRRGALWRVYVFIERVKFFAGDVDSADQPGWNTEAFAWFVWRDGFDGDPTIRWLSRDAGAERA